jgi:ferredoxin
VDEQLCVGNKTCVEIYSKIFVMPGDVAIAKIEEVSLDLEEVCRVAAEPCRGHCLRKRIAYLPYMGYQEDFMSWAADAYMVKSSDLSELKGRIKEILSTRDPHANT